MKQWRIDVFSKYVETQYFDDQYDAIRYAIKAAQMEPTANIYLLEKISDSKYGNIVQLYKAEREVK